jgi:hypothetical protein
MSDTPTPRTDERAHKWETGGEWCDAEFARQLERENQTFRNAQKACEYCDAPRVDRIAELERELTELRFAAARVEWKYGRTDDGKPKNWVEWNDLRDSLGEHVRQPHEIESYDGTY